MKDILGNTIEIGDSVVYSDSYSRMKEGKVLFALSVSDSKYLKLIVKNNHYTVGEYWSPVTIRRCDNVVVIRKGNV